MSCLSAGQNSLIFSYKHCWRSADKPVGGMTEGSWSGVGAQVSSLSNLTARSSAVLEVFTNTVPGKLE